MLHRRIDFIDFLVDMATFHVADLETLQYITQQGQDDVLIASNTVSYTTTAVWHIQNSSLVWRFPFQEDFLINYNREMGMILMK
jgi:hypothetical protein